MKAKIPSSISKQKHASGMKPDLVYLDSIQNDSHLQSKFNKTNHKNPLAAMGPGLKQLTSNVHWLFELLHDRRHLCPRTFLQDCRSGSMSKCERIKFNGQAISTHLPRHAQCHATATYGKLPSKRWKTFSTNMSLSLCLSLSINPVEAAVHTSTPSTCQYFFFDVMNLTII